MRVVHIGCLTVSDLRLNIMFWVVVGRCGWSEERSCTWCHRCHVGGANFDSTDTRIEVINSNDQLESEEERVLEGFWSTSWQRERKRSSKLKLMATWIVCPKITGRRQISHRWTNSDGIGWRDSWPQGTERWRFRGEMPKWYWLMHHTDLHGHFCRSRQKLFSLSKSILENEVEHSCKSGERYHRFNSKKILV